jgi:hypothetical protein
MTPSAPSRPSGKRLQFMATAQGGAPHGQDVCRRTSRGRSLQLGSADVVSGLTLAFPSASKDAKHSAEALGALIGKKLNVEGTLGERDGTLQLTVKNLLTAP